MFLVDLLGTKKILDYLGLLGLEQNLKSYVQIISRLITGIIMNDPNDW